MAGLLKSTNPLLHYLSSFDLLKLVVLIDSTIPLSDDSASMRSGFSENAWPHGLR